MTYSTQGIVLKKIPIGEADAMIVLYTPDVGKLRALAQGVKKEEAKLKGHVEPLSLSSIQFVVGAYGERIIYALMMQSWPSIRGDYEKYAAASYLLELVDRHCLVGQKDSAIWEFMVANLALLERTRHTDIVSAVETFEREFLSCLGYGGAKDIRVLGHALARPVGMVYNKI
ncbi:MAG: DNA repair protein RecO [Candidatus Sungbacteria bacterium]|nr:DNA repair protein RecO [bacterium]MDZ4286294.1 DNA repair protein RecO [Candidatus Sungbacteria bacterium]